MGNVRKIIAEEVAKVFENEESLSHEDLVKELKFARHYLEILDAETHQARQIVYTIQGMIESERDSSDCQELLNRIHQQTRKLR